MLRCECSFKEIHYDAKFLCEKARVEGVFCLLGSVLVPGAVMPTVLLRLSWALALRPGIWLCSWFPFIKCSIDLVSLLPEVFSLLCGVRCPSTQPSALNGERVVYGLSHTSPPPRHVWSLCDQAPVGWKKPFGSVAGAVRWLRPYTSISTSEALGRFERRLTPHF